MYEKSIGQPPTGSRVQWRGRAAWNSLRNEFFVTPWEWIRRESVLIDLSNGLSPRYALAWLSASCPLLPACSPPGQQEWWEGRRGGGALHSYA